MPSQESSLLAQLQATSKEYHNEIFEKTFLKQTFEGGENYIRGGHLFKHGRENKTDYDRRVNRSYFQNFCAPLIGIFAGFLTGQIINRKNGFRNPKRFEEFLNDINGEGEGIVIFISNLIQWTAAQGEGYVMVDRPIGIQEEPLTKADERNSGIVTTAKRLDWSDVLDWEEGENEEFNWIKIRDIENKPRNPLEKEELITRYKIITKEYWQIYEVDSNNVPVLVREGKNSIGMVPVFCVEWPGGSMMKDASRVNRAVYNWCSLLDENLYRQTFAQLCIAGDPVDELKMGTSSALTYEPGTPAPSFIAPPSSPCDTLRSNIDAGKKAIKEMILFRAEEGIMDQSGISKSYDFAQLNNVLLAAAKVFENVEEKIYRLYALWESEPAENIQVQYPQSFDIANVSAMMDDALKTQTINMGKEFDRYLKKKISRGFVDSRDAEDQKKIDAEILSGSTEIQPLPPITPEEIIEKMPMRIEK